MQVFLRRLRQREPVEAFFFDCIDGKSFVCVQSTTLFQVDLMSGLSRRGGVLVHYPKMRVSSRMVRPF